MIKMSSKNTKLLIFNFIIFIIGLLFYLLDLYDPIFGLALTFYGLMIVIFVKKTIDQKVDIIDMVVMYLLLYPLVCCVVFGYKPLFSHFNNYLPAPMYTSDHCTNKYNLIMMISTMPFLHILLDDYKLNFSANGKKLIKRWKRKSLSISRGNESRFTFQMVLVLSMMGLLLFYLYYIHIATRGVYIAIIQTAAANKMANLMGWISILTSGAILSVYSNDKGTDKKKWVYLLLVMLVIMFWVLKSRMYCAMFLIEILICKYLDGFRFKKKHIFFLFLCMCILLFTATLRFSSYNYGNFYYDLFTIIGEFALSGVSSYYLINNPFEFQDPLRIRDLFFQLLPSGMRPMPALMDFHEFCISHGYNPWPAGGIQFQGQMYFYVGIFFLVGEIIVIKYLRYVRRKLNKGQVTPLVAGFPVFCLILPRMQVWTLRSMIFAGLMFYIMSRMGRCGFKSTIYYCKRYKEKLSRILDF